MFSCFRGRMTQSNTEATQLRTEPGETGRPSGALGEHAIELAGPMNIPRHDDLAYRKKKYKTVGMVQAYQLTDQTNNIRYLNEQERKRYRVTFDHDGRVVNSTGTALDTANGLNPAGRYLFVMDERGRIYAGPNQEVRHHSAFLAAHPAAAAGHLEIVEGRMTKLDDRSGHYAPPREFSAQFKKELESRGIDTTNVQEKYVGREKAFYKERHFRSDRVYPSTDQSGVETWTRKTKKY